MSRVCNALFAAEPKLRKMFTADPLGSMRGEMFHRVVDSQLDVAGGRPQARGKIPAEGSNHQMDGVSTAQFQRFFDSVAQVFRDPLGSDWTPQVDAAWRHALQRVAEIGAQAAAQP